MWPFKKVTSVELPEIEPMPIITRLEIPHLSIAFDQLHETPDEDMLKAVLDNRKAYVEILKNANLSLWHSSLVATSEAAKLVGQHFDRTRGELEEATARFARSPAPDLHSILFIFLFVSLAIAGEYSLTVTTWPALLNIEPRSLFGLLLGAVPISAAKCLEPAIRRLRALHAMLTDAVRPSVRFLGYTLEAFTMVSVLAANGIMVTHLAEARYEVAKIINELAPAADNAVTGEQPDPLAKVDDNITYKAIISVSLVIVLDAGIFFLLLADELALWSQRRSAKRQVKRARKSARQMEREHLMVEHQRQCAERLFDVRHELANAIGRADLSKCEADLHGRPPRKAPSTESVLDDLLLAYMPKPRLTVVK